jgi:S1-C subfamily serine protease
LEFNGGEVNSTGQLRNKVATSAVDTEVTLGILRDGEK